MRVVCTVFKNDVFIMCVDSIKIIGFLPITHITCIYVFHVSSVNTYLRRLFWIFPPPFLSTSVIWILFTLLQQTLQSRTLKWMSAILVLKLLITSHSKASERWLNSKSRYHTFQQKWRIEKTKTELWWEPVCKVSITFDFHWFLYLHCLFMSYDIIISPKVEVLFILFCN